MVNHKNAVGDVAGVLFFVWHFVNEWVWKEFLDQCVNLAVESCREKQLLAFTSGTHDAANTFDEAKITHVVGFVNNQGFNQAEVDNALSH